MSLDRIDVGMVLSSGRAVNRGDHVSDAAASSNRRGNRAGESRVTSLLVPLLLVALLFSAGPPPTTADEPFAKTKDKTPANLNVIRFSHQSVRSGNWSDPRTWKPLGVPGANSRVIVHRGHRVLYDVDSDAPVRLLQVAGALSFARDRNTSLTVGILKIQNSSVCSESGFACDFHTINDVGEPHAAPDGPLPALEIGTPENPLPAQYTAKIRLKFFEGMNRDDAPALSCCSARLDLHGAPMSRTWVDLGADAEAGEKTLTLSEEVTGWQAGDQLLVTGSKHGYSGGRFRSEQDSLESEVRRIAAIDGTTVTLNESLKRNHTGSGPFRSEAANLSRNIMIESADPDGVRGHTICHRFSQARIGYARFAHLGKENVLGRYSIHFHLVGSTNRGGSLIGAAIVDSHNRWVTVHGTNYLVVRDCVGYKSVGHGFFLEDGTETWNVFDRNLGVHAFLGRRLPKQVLPFDPNDGAAFWWSNGRNTFVRNTSCENDRYGFRYDSQKRSNLDSNLIVLQPDGTERQIDIRTIPIYRFQDNEAHTEGLYGMALAGTDRAGPDTRHPHVLKDLRIWQVHYGLRSQLPTMWIEGVKIDHAAYGIYRPEFENHVYRDLYIGHTNTEPFNRGLDDRSTQYGRITVDGLTFEGNRNSGMPLIQISANNPTGEAESHFRNVQVINRRDGNRRALVNLGGGPRRNPTTPTGVPVYLHDYYGPGRTAKVVSTRAKDLLNDGNQYREDPPLTGDESRVAEVSGVEFPTLLEPVDDLPPATIITFPVSDVPATAADGVLVVRGTTTDNEKTKRVTVGGVEAKSLDYNFHRWEARLTGVKAGKLKLTARAEDAAGNVEQTPHVLEVTVR